MFDYWWTIYILYAVLGVIITRKVIFFLIEKITNIKK